MENREQLPSLGLDVELSRRDLDNFRERVLWPAIDDLYMDDFRASAAPGEIWEITHEIEEPVIEEVTYKLRLRAEHIQSGDDGQYRWFRSSFSILTPHELLIDERAELREATIAWEVIEYEFRQAREPSVNIYFEFHGPDGEVLDQESDMSDSESQLFEDLKGMAYEYNLDRESCTEIYCGLLAMKASEEEMKYEMWAQSLRSQ